MTPAGQGNWILNASKIVQDYVDGIRERYREDWKSKDTFKQQMGVALYFIDKLALRAGHEKDEDEADTVGCCTLKVQAFLGMIVRHFCGLERQI